MISDPGMGICPPRVLQDLGVVPRGNSRRVLAPRASANQHQPAGLGFPHLAGRSDPEDLRFRPRFVGVVDIWEDF